MYDDYNSKGAQCADRRILHSASVNLHCFGWKDAPRLTRKRDLWPFNTRQWHLLHQCHLLGKGKVFHWIRGFVSAWSKDLLTAGWLGCNQSLSTLTIGREDPADKTLKTLSKSEREIILSPRRKNLPSRPISGIKRRKRSFSIIEDIFEP